MTSAVGGRLEGRGVSRRPSAMRVVMEGSERACRSRPVPSLPVEPAMMSFIMMVMVENLKA